MKCDEAGTDMDIRQESWGGTRRKCQCLVHIKTNYFHAIVMHLEVFSTYFPLLKENKKQLSTFYPPFEIKISYCSAEHANKLPKYLKFYFLSSPFCFLMVNQIQ